MFKTVDGAIQRGEITWLHIKRWAGPRTGDAGSNIIKAEEDGLRGLLYMLAGLVIVGGLVWMAPWYEFDLKRFWYVFTLPAMILFRGIQLRRRSRDGREQAKQLLLTLKEFHRLLDSSNCDMRAEWDVGRIAVMRLFDQAQRTREARAAYEALGPLARPDRKEYETWQRRNDNFDHMYTTFSRFLKLESQETYFRCGPSQIPIPS